MRTLFRLAAIGLLLVPATAAAQSGRLSGVITDPSGLVLPAVNVRATIRDGNQQTTSTVTSDRNGRYTLDGLAPGTYAVAMTLPGFDTATLSVPVAGDAQQDVTLQVGMIEETITVAPGGPPIASVHLAQPPLPPPPATKPTVGGNLKPPTKIGNVAPVYPASLAAQKTGGNVVLMAVIGTDGLVRDVKTISSPDPELTGAASVAFSQWEFTPTLLNGSPIETRIRGTFHFNAN